ncbi:transposase-like zinc-binding domain-containing protein [Hymenobacter roseosalivarius]
MGREVKTSHCPFQLEHLIQHTCARCGSERIRRNGHSSGHARYQCKACGYQARFLPVAPSERPATRRWKSSWPNAIPNTVSCA